MFRPSALRLLPICLLAAALPSLPGCKSASFKFPGFKKRGDTQAVAEPAPGGQAAVPRSPEEAAFLTKCAELAGAGTTIAGRDGFFFSPVELQRLVQLQDPDSASVRAATAAITDYNNQLKAKGISLIVLPVPPKAIVFPDKLSKDLKVKVRRNKVPRFDSTLQTIYANLRNQGVSVMDPTDVLINTRDLRKLGPVFPRTAGVWSPRGAETVAGFLSKELKSAPWANQPGKDGPLITEAAVLSFVGPLVSPTPQAETLPIRNIGRSADGKMRSVTFSQGGNSLALIGDPALLAWREANNPPGSSNAFGSLADQIAFELQTTPDLFPGNPEGRNSSRSRLLRDATNGRNPLGSTKVMIWVVQSTDFIFSDWKRIPLKLSFSSAQPPVMLAPPVGLIPDPATGSRQLPPPSNPPALEDEAAPPTGEPELPR